MISVWAVLCGTVNWVSVSGWRSAVERCQAGSSRTAMEAVPAGITARAATEQRARESRAAVQRVDPAVLCWRETFRLFHFFSKFPLEETLPVCTSGFIL